MKATLIRLAVVWLLLTFPAFSQPLNGECRLENVSSSNQSIQQCAVFSIVAGADVTIQSSTDLVSWTEETSYYSLGGEFVFPMREFTAAPPPVPGTPTTPILPTEKNVSLLLQPASGTGGGTVASWPSLDGNGPILVHLTESLAPAWELVPHFVESCGGYLIMVWHPPFPTEPPAENSILGEKDAAFFEMLETHLSAMNSAVATSAIAARNSPPPAPSAPGSKKFFRAFKRFPDTDGDGSPDYLEFQMLLLPVGTGAARGNPFDPDTNGNGVPDGKELDFDGDGTVDADDVSPSDLTDAAAMIHVPRYAFFEINKPAVQINDLGTVLMADSTWKAGETKPLAGTGPAWNDANAFAINDSDMILGHHLRELSYTTSNGNSGTDAIPTYSFWLGRTSAIAHLVKIDSGITYYGGPSYREGGDGPVLSEDGVVYGDRHSYQEIKGGWVQESPYFIINSQPATNTVWQLPTAGNTNVSWLTRPGNLYYESDGIRWGVELEGNVPKGVVYDLAKYKLLPSVPRRVFRDSTNPTRLIALDSSEAWTATPTEEWKKSEKYRYAQDIAKDGTAIGINHPDPQKTPPGNFIAPIQINGKWQGIEHTAPGLPARVTTHLQLADTTPKGWVLGSFHEGLTTPTAEDYHAGVMLPLRAKGTAPDVIASESTGVDEFSIGSTDPDFGALDGTKPVNDRIWVMAPINGSTPVLLDAPLNPQSSLKLSAPGVTFSPDTLTNQYTNVSISATEAASGQEILVDLTLGTATSLSKPLGLKVMKSRTIKAKLYKVTKLTPGQPDDAPDFMPSVSGLQDFLNAVYKPQINADFLVSDGGELKLNWDMNGNGLLDGRASIGYNNLNEQGLILSAAGEDLETNISIYIVSGGDLISGSALGVANRNTRTVWISGDFWKPGMTGTPNRVSAASSQGNTIAHEVGHIIVGPGHPDLKDGRAPLPGTDHRQRLMMSGSTSGRYILSGTRLVKAEWDEAEKWMVSEQNSGRIIDND